MEEGSKSGDSNGVVVKSKNSSGCLIVRKKSDGSSGSNPVFYLSKEKKRVRLIGSDSGSSDEELEPPFQKRVSNGSDKGVVENSDVSGSERKTSKLGVFEFDEYDAPYNSDDEAIGKSFFGSKTTTSGSKGDIVYKRKHSYFDRGSDYVNKRFETKKLRDSSEEPIRVQGRNGVLKVMPSRKKKGSGLLKTYDHMKAGTSSRDTVKKNELGNSPFYSEQKVHSKAGPSTRTEKNKLNLQKSSASKKIKSPSWESDNSNSSPKRGKNKSKSKKTPAKKNSKALDWESDNSDTSLKLEPMKLEDRTPVKLVSSKEETTPPSGKILANRSNEGKIKRGSGTEKQKLREQIKKMLLDSGWTIDYRPRRNRDYQDAVYVNPSGTAYWSIVKAYDALQKQFGEEEDSLKLSGDYSFSPISDDVISKLTRQTQKKMEKEMKRKQRDTNGSKNAQGRATKRPAKYKHDMMSKSSNKAQGKSWKSRTKENASTDSSSENQNEENYTSEDNLDGNLSVNWRKNKTLGRCTLVVRSSEVQNSQSDGYIPYTGKRTLLSWLIDSETVGLSEKVQYMNRRQTRVMLEGWITRDGIHCGCCSKILTVTKFEMHAGSKLRQPYQNIYLESGISLLQCQMDAWNRQEESKLSSFHSVHVDGDDPNDDTCGICGDGGDLICCDGCPSTFHQTCLGIEMLPTGDWHCPNCICKLCGMVGSSSSHGNEIAGPVLPTCSLCERKYHQSCIQDVDALHIDSTCPSFCGKKCREMFENLQKFIGTKHDLEGGFSWSLIHRTDIPDLDTSVRGLTQRVECNSKLAVALTVMDECFLPILDRRSGINLIRNVLYNCGSNFSRLNYSGFYTAILEKGDEIIAAASIRFHGTQLAEMPFIGTRHIYRRQGMCNRLFRAIELALCSFKVEKLIIPAISELMHTWTEVFGFANLEESQKEELRSMSVLVFPGIDMLRKLLLEDEINLQNVTTSTGEKSKELEGEPSLTADTLNKSSEDSGDTHVVGTDDNVVASDSTPQSSEIVLHDATLPVTALDTTHEVKVSLSTHETMCTSSQSEDKVPVSATGLKPIFSEGANNAALERRDNLIQDSKYMDDTNDSNNNAASVEPVSHSVENVSAQIGTEAADENEDDHVFVSSLHENDENLMQINSDLYSDKSHCNETLVDSFGECAGTRVCEIETASHLGNNLPESSNVLEVQTGSQSDDDMVDYDSKPKCVSPCNNNQIVSKMVDTHADQHSVECQTGSQLGKSLCESALDSETIVLEVHAKSQSDYEMEENASKLKCVSPSNKNEDAFRMEDTLTVDTSNKCTESAVCEMGTECQLGKNISESASDSRINVFKVETKSQSDDDFAESISPCNQNQYASLAVAVDASLGGALQSSLEPETESLNDSVAYAEPVVYFSGKIPTDNSTEAINEDMKITPFSDGIDDSLSEA